MNTALKGAGTLKYSLQCSEDSGSDKPWKLRVWEPNANFDRSRLVDIDNRPMAWAFKQEFKFKGDAIQALDLMLQGNSGLVAVETVAKVKAKKVAA